MSRLTGRVALVTGAARGIGAATARALAAEGALVACADLDGDGVERLVSDVGGLALAGNVSNARTAAGWIAAVVERWGRLDVMINNAGIALDSLADVMAEEDWDQVINVNLKGTFLCSQEAMAIMRGQGSGVIVNTASLSAWGNVGQANYAASKAGIIGLTKTFALEGARFGIRVNAVAPGAVESAMTRDLPDSYRQRVLAQIPLGRIATPEDIADVHVFLASGAARYITGQVLIVDGGLSVGAVRNIA